MLAGDGGLAPVALPRRIQRFQVTAHLGAGGMGAVFRARDPQLQRDVAIKLLRASRPLVELSPDDTVDLRTDAPASPDDLLREARMMARLSHQNVLPVYEVGVFEGAVFVVMEHIDGEDLTRWLARSRSTDEILGVFGQAAQGLLAAHRCGVVHGDVKPANILVGADGRVRVADFGLSRLIGRPPGGMVRVDDRRGTPRFMAPELGAGNPPTPASDVFALCRGLIEALGAGEATARERTLRERAVPHRLRGALTRGLAVDPAGRPTLAELIAAMAGRSRHRRAWAIGLAVAGAAGVAAFTVLPAAGEDAPSCAVDPPAYWTAPRRAGLRALLAGPTGFAGAAADRVIADLGAQEKAIGDGMLGACRAARAGQIGEPEREVRESCYERRGFELAAVVDYLFETRADVSSASDRVAALAPAGDCGEIASRPIASDRAAVAGLWRRFVNSARDSVPDRVADHIRELKAIEEQATAAGEIDLAVRVALWLGIELRYTDQLDAADQAFQRAYRMAVPLRLTELGARILVERSVVASRRGDGAAARSYSELAMDVASRPTTSPDTRAAIHEALGRAAQTRGDNAVAIEHLRKAIDIRHRFPVARSVVNELGARYNLVTAIASGEKLDPGLVPLARESVELARKELGERDPSYAAALNQLGEALRRSGDVDGGLRVLRQGVALMGELLPSGDSTLLTARSGLAGTLFFAGQAAEAREELGRAIAQVEGNEAMRAHRAQLAGLYAAATFEVGRLEEGVELAADAVEEGIEIHGKDHPTTLALRWYLAQMQLELGRVQPAARTLAALRAGLRTRADEHQIDVLRIGATLEAELAILQGRPRVAEAAVRAALAEPSFSAAERAVFDVELGASLLAQRRFRPARAALRRGLDAASAAGWRGDAIASAEARLALAELGLGRRAIARARARRVSAALARFPAQRRARADVDRVLGAGKRPTPRPRAPHRARSTRR